MANVHTELSLEAFSSKLTPHILRLILHTYIVSFPRRVLATPYPFDKDNKFIALSNARFSASPLAMTSRKSSTQRKLFNSFKPVVIHDSDDEETEEPDSASPVAKRRKTTSGKSAFHSTPARATKKSTTAVVTPADEKNKKKDIVQYVPKYIHKNVEYSRQGNAKLSDTTQSAFAWIQQHVNLPKDLEQNRIYGPLSGSSYEERTVRAYRLGLIQSSDDGVQFCTACATVGHLDDDCPTLLD